MLVSGSLLTNMRISWPEFHNSNVVEIIVVYSAKTDNEPAYHRRFPRNNPSTTLAAIPGKFGVGPLHFFQQADADSCAGIAQSQGNVHRRDDS